jgi:hypothetical protein
LRAETAGQDVLGESPARFSELLGLAHVPWDVKALFGMASDIWPLCGYHLAPYHLRSMIPCPGTRN